MAESRETPCIYVLAGTNGAGKSSIAGAMFLDKGVEYFNPDEAAKRILAANPGISVAEANSAAWWEGRRLLECAIFRKLNYAFETTLGGTSITALLEKALSEGMEVRIWYVGLMSPELHVARVRARVKIGGHDIPEEKIRERYTHSRLNLIQLLPTLTELLVYDNSEEVDMSAGQSPQPRLILHFTRGKIADICELSRVPEWAKPIVMETGKLPDKL